VLSVYQFDPSATLAAPLALLWKFPEFQKSTGVGQFIDMADMGVSGRSSSRSSFAIAGTLD